MVEAHAAIWTADSTVDHSGPLNVATKFKSDVLDLLQAEGTTPPGCVSWFIKGPIRIDLSVDASPISNHKPGQIVSAAGRWGKYRFQISLDHSAHPNTSEIVTSINLNGRGLGRLPLAFFGRSVKRILSEAVEELLADDQLREIVEQLEEVAAEVERLGSVERFVQAAIWDPAYEWPKDRSA